MTKVVDHENAEVAEVDVPLPFESAAPKALDQRAVARAALLSNSKKPARKEFTFNDVKLEFVVPTIGKMYKQRPEASQDRIFFVRQLIENTVLAGTNIAPFEDEDYDSLLEMAFSKDMGDFTTIVTELLELNTAAEVKN